MSKAKKEELKATETTELKTTEIVGKKEEIKTQQEPEIKKEEIKTQQEPEVLEVTVNSETAFNLKLQEFDKMIGIAKLRVAELEAQKMTFIYDSNLQAITDEHKQMLIKKQIEEEFKAKSKN